MSPSTEELDDVAAAMDEHLGKKPAAPQENAPAQPAQPSPAAQPAPAPSRPPRPWELEGRKYPLALDYKDDATAKSINDWLDMVSGKEGAAAKCFVGEALACNIDYYKADVDVHPLIQLSVAGLAFGGVVAFGKWQEHQKEKEAEAAGVKTPEQKEKEAALERLSKARGQKPDESGVSA